MASPGLPTNVASGGTGQIAHTNATHSIVNNFDTAIGGASSGEVLKWNGSVYAPATDLQASYSGTGQMHVDPIKGVNGKDGLTWLTAKQTIAAAVSAATTGMEILLAPGDYDLAGTKITLPGEKILSIRGAKPLSTAQFSNAKSARILNSGALLSAYFETDHGSSNHYGWRFSDLYFEIDGLARDGAAIALHGVNVTRFDRLGARQLTQTPGTRWLVRSTLSDNKSDASGGDHSWYVFRDIHTMNGVKLFQGTGTQNNYHRFESCLIHGDGSIPAGPAIDIAAGSEATFLGVNFEQWGTGIKLTHQRNPSVQVVGESTETAVHLVDCYDARVNVASLAGSGSRKGIDEITGTRTWTGGPNKWDGPIEVVITGAGHRAEYSSYRTRTVPPQYVANQGIVPVYNDHAGLAYKPIPMLPQGMSGIDILASVGLTVDYWNGSAWVAWYKVDTANSNVLLVDDPYTLDITSTQKRFRIRTAAEIPVAGTLIAALETFATGTAHTFTVRTQDAARATLTERTMNYGRDGEFTAPQNLSGFVAPVRGGRHIEVEGNFNLTTEPIYFKRLALIQAPWDIPATYGGRKLTSRLSPQSLITGVVGDQCTVTTGTNAGIWAKTSGTGNTGWTKLS